MNASSGMLRTAIATLAVAAVAVVAFALGRAARLGSPLRPEPTVLVAVDSAGVADRLAGAIRFETTAARDGSGDGSAFLGLHRYLRHSYPLVHGRLGCEEVGGTSLLCEWPGTDRASAPLVLMAHLDVVPIARGSEASWTHPPHSGAIDGGFVYGRGALDDKSAVIAILEAAETLLRDGHRPRRTIYLAFGGDEELGGERGALQIVRLLRSRGVKDPAMVIDEGGALVEGAFPGLEGAVAVVGIAEKGYLSLELSARGP